MPDTAPTAAATEPKPTLIPTGEATAILPMPDGKGPPVSVFGTQKIRDGFDAMCLRQAINSNLSPGVTRVVLNPDAHAGYGAPIGCVMVSPDHIYPGPVGVDIKCSMSLLQLDLPAEQVNDRRTRREVINAILQRTPTGAGRGGRSVKKGRRVDEELGKRIAVEGGSHGVCTALGIPPEWAERCEDSAHVGHDGTGTALADRLERLLHGGRFRGFADRVAQCGSYGGGNHFGECEVVRVADDDRAREVAEVFGLLDGRVAFLSHCGSRGFGYALADNQFKTLQGKFATWSIPLPGGDRELVYAPLGTPEADDYIDDMSMGANFATVNHLLINALVLDAFREVFPGVNGRLVYFISHNIARQERVDGKLCWVHRKGATRAFPAGHPALRGTVFAPTGHPILLPGNPMSGSAVMVGRSGAEASVYSVNHGAGRAMGRKAAIRALDQGTIDRAFDDADILSNCRQYPKDEAPAAYKDFDEVLRSVEVAGLASTVARLQARFVIKDADDSNGGAA
jgi:tRNA-splicing ligase RtcB